ncbi:hypothetical protein [Candidatus Pelagibacter sp. HIMB1746]|uniref:hypothetical protein n=1 Tax=Candidatus Pelagibacter sp. HIMB1746 TaxID=3413370 RepID=UPI003F83E319
MTVSQNKKPAAKIENSKLAKFFRKYFNKQQQHINQIYLDNELLAKMLMEYADAYLRLYNEYQENLSVYKKNQKLFQKQLRDFDTMMSFAWSADEMGIDTKSDVITFTKKEKLKYIQDYTIEFDQTLMESGKKIEKLKLIKKKKEAND